MSAYTAPFSQQAYQNFTGGGLNGFTRSGEALQADLAQRMEELKRLEAQNQELFAQLQRPQVQPQAVSRQAQRPPTQQKRSDAEFDQKCRMAFKHTPVGERVEKDFYDGFQTWLANSERGLWYKQEWEKIKLASDKLDYDAMQEYASQNERGQELMSRRDSAYNQFRSNFWDLFIAMQQRQETMMCQAAQEPQTSHVAQSGPQPAAMTPPPAAVAPQPPAIAPVPRQTVTTAVNAGNGTVGNAREAANAS